MSKNRYANCFVECVADPQYPGLYVPVDVVSEKKQGDFIYHNASCQVYADGSFKPKAVSNLIGSLAICYGKDIKGRLWELFIEPCYYDMPCVKMVNDRDFNSPWNLNFSTIDEAKDKMAELMVKPDWWVQNACSIHY